MLDFCGDLVYEVLRLRGVLSRDRALTEKSAVSAILSAGREVRGKGEAGPSYLTFPGPHNARPGFAPVCSPSLSTWTPFTNTSFMPTAYWWGFS